MPSDFITLTPKHSDDALWIIITVNTAPYPLAPYVPLLPFLFYLFILLFFPLLPLILFYIITTEAFHTIYVSAFFKDTISGKNLLIKNDAGKVTSKQMWSDRLSGVEKYNIVQ